MAARRTTAQQHQPPPPLESKASKSESKVLDIVAAMRHYVLKMLATVVSTTKVLLMDVETMSHVALVMTQTEIVSHGVVLTSLLDRLLPTEESRQAPQQQPRRPRPASASYLTAILLVRPTPENMSAIKRLLQESSPRYKDIHLFFTNIVAAADLSALAEADEFSRIRQVQEYYLDVRAVDRNFFHLGLAGSGHGRLLRRQNEMERWTLAEHQLMQRNVDGLVATMLAFRRQFSVRYSAGSPLATIVTQELVRRMQADRPLFHFGGGSDHSRACLLLVIDRKDDPVTPLLSQWTYQAMVHELVGISDNVVSSLRPTAARVPAHGAVGNDLLLSSAHDAFYERTKDLLFGEVAVQVKALIDQYKREHAIAGHMNELADMQAFLERWPEFQAVATNSSKHTAVVLELGRLVEERGLYELSQVEQDLACKTEHSTALAAVWNILGRSSGRSSSTAQEGESKNSIIASAAGAPGGVASDGGGGPTTRFQDSGIL